jgi:hypothetical protein
MRSSAPGALDEHAFGFEQRLAEGLEPGGAQRRAGLDDIGDGVGDAELDRDLDGAVELDGRRVDAALVRGRRRRGSGSSWRCVPRASSSGEVNAAGGAGVEEPGGTEPEAEHLLGLGTSIRAADRGR